MQKESKTHSVILVLSYDLFSNKLIILKIFALEKFYFFKISQQKGKLEMTHVIFIYHAYVTKNKYFTQFRQTTRER